MVGFVGVVNTIRQRMMTSFQSTVDFDDLLSRVDDFRMDYPINKLFLRPRNGVSFTPDGRPVLNVSKSPEFFDESYFSFGACDPEDLPSARKCAFIDSLSLVCYMDLLSSYAQNRIGTAHILYHAVASLTCVYSDLYERGKRISFSDILDPGQWRRSAEIVHFLRRIKEFHSGEQPFNFCLWLTPEYFDDLDIDNLFASCYTLEEQFTQQVVAGLDIPHGLALTGMAPARYFPQASVLSKYRRITDSRFKRYIFALTRKDTYIIFPGNFESTWERGDYTDSSSSDGDASLRIPPPSMSDHGSGTDGEDEVIPPPCTLR